MTNATNVFLALSLVIGFTGPLEALQAPPVEGIDTASVRGFWTDLDTAWHVRDLDPFVRCFTADASFALVDRGIWLEGEGDLCGYFAEQFSSQRPELRHVTEITRFRRLAEGTIAVDGEIRIVDAARRPPADIRRLAVTAVMVHGPMGWRIQLLRALILAPPGGL